jgi:hypothetical protein
MPATGNRHFADQDCTKRAPGIFGYEVVSRTGLNIEIYGQQGRVAWRKRANLKFVPAKRKSL